MNTVSTIILSETTFMNFARCFAAVLCIPFAKLCMTRNIWNISYDKAFSGLTGNAARGRQLQSIMAG